VGKTGRLRPACHSAKEVRQEKTAIKKNRRGFRENSGGAWLRGFRFFLSSRRKSDLAGEKQLGNKIHGADRDVSIQTDSLEVSTTSGGD